VRTVRLAISPGGTQLQLPETPNAALTERGAEAVEKTTGVSPRPVEGRS